ncbi:MAG: biotin transporter BioY [Anaerolineae bacterium]|nr:biotin transporter BioY [Anaerolineae bacterium]
MTFRTYADSLRPTAKQKALAYDALLVIGGSLFIALCAQFTLHIGPVPITGQTLGVLLAGVLLGSRRGSLSVLAYLMEGIAGLPVFAPGGPLGLARLVGPTGGYLIGFVATAYATGLLAERGWDRRAATALATMLIGNVTIYAFGLPWLALFVGIEHALPLGLYPFIAGDILKAISAAAMLPTGWKLLNRQA